MTREEASRIVLEMLKQETDLNKLKALNIALDSIAAVDKISNVLESYLGK